jgi:hypothetical protein
MVRKNVTIYGVAFIEKFMWESDFIMGFLLKDSLRNGMSSSASVRESS